MNDYHPLFDSSITWLTPQQLIDYRNKVDIERRAKLERFDRKPDFDSLPEIERKRMTKSKYER